MTTGLRLDPATAFRFVVLVDALPVAGFTECTGLQGQVEVFEYMEGGLNTHTQKLFGMGQPSQQQNDAPQN